MNRKGDDSAHLDWMAGDGSPISCPEKLKVLNENLDEVRQVCRDAYEDAVLMGCDREQVRNVLRQVVASLDDRFGT